MPSVDDIVGELRGILRDLQGLDFFPPWDAINTLIRLANRAREIAMDPPDPDPETVRGSVDEWHLISADMERAHADLLDLEAAMTVDIWEGCAGDSFRVSVGNLAHRVDSVPAAASGVENALGVLAVDMEACRHRHGEAFSQLGDAVDIGWGDLWPWEMAGKIGSAVEGLIHGVQELIGAYQDAATAHAAARRAVRNAMDTIDLPDHLPGDVPSIIDVVNSWDDEEGPLNGSVLSRYDDAMAKMTPEERAAVEAALADTEFPGAAAWIMAAVASGLTGAALLRYIQQVRGMNPGELDALDPRHFRDGPATQPDQTTCGSSSLVMSRMENNPAYAMWMLTGYDPLTGETDPRTPEERFADESEEMHVRTNLPIDRDHQAQFPWPPQAGTQPWAVAAEMSADGGSGVPGTDYGVAIVDPDDRGESYDAIVAASEDGHTVPIYVGNEARPGHVALVTATDGDTITIYEPAHGDTVTVTRDEWLNGDVDVAGWDEPWAVVVPD
jgi:hypothetical protein